MGWMKGAGQPAAPRLTSLVVVAPVRLLAVSALPAASHCRPVVLSTLRALPDGRTEFRIRTTILFILKPNGFIKAMIDKGGWMEGFCHLLSVFDCLQLLTGWHQQAGCPGKGTVTASAVRSVCSLVIV